jgi:hypothetical protein
LNEYAHTFEQRLDVHELASIIKLAEILGLLREILPLDE